MIGVCTTGDATFGVVLGLKKLKSDFCCCAGVLLEALDLDDDGALAGVLAVEDGFAGVFAFGRGKKEVNEAEGVFTLDVASDAF